jgi:hypothetical protein
MYWARLLSRLIQAVLDRPAPGISVQHLHVLLALSVLLVLAFFLQACTLDPSALGDIVQTLDDVVVVTGDQTPE